MLGFGVSLDISDIGLNLSQILDLSFMQEPIFTAP